MKKLLIMAFAVLTVSAFAAEESKENTVENKNIESTHILEAKDIANVQVQEVSLGESFMAAFGMSEGNVGGSSSSQTSSAGATTAATNAAVTSSNNSVTIITPYGKY
ncbi:MAG: hypothetical protein ACLSVP_03180 [Fusobacterium sp.]|jgi:hypothetical protein|uniref:hypothetical protein n=1 Tax=uncultured Fusobacterium sp. TaxID=159267 RepID=UPI00265F9807|nr:hypothetical protein [uncultured Fusobacterium sp.]